MSKSFHLLLLGTFICTLNVNAQFAELKTQFSTDKIIVDGKEEKVWETISAANVAKAMTANLDAEAADCKTNGKLKAIWNGSLLYILIKVKDAEVTVVSEKVSEKDGVEIFLDLWNDKYPKYEEDDGMLQISADGKQFTRGTNTDRFEASATSIWKDKNGGTIGYIVEAAINIGGLSQSNGTKIGFEIGINDIDAETNKKLHRIFWSSGENHGLDNNSKWGTIILEGYDGTSAKAIDAYSLKRNIEKAESLASGIWQSEEELQKSLAKAKTALVQNSQTEIDASTIALKTALKNVRRKGTYPDPYDLPVVNHLPDPFLFQDGSKVERTSDWKKRADEIRDLAQYYEYGNLPESPEKLSASLEGKKLMVKIEDGGKTVEFEAQLTVPTENQSGKVGPYPVVVSIDFRLGNANEIYLKAGYAVLSVRYTSVASDNKEHTGPFYELYPYDITKGRDTGTLLAWAWGAMRAVDALEYLVANNGIDKNTIDVDKLVVTGFSRCGKAALAAGLFDDRFDVVSPGASGCGGAAVFRYATMDNPTIKQSSYQGHVYPWGQSYGSEVMGDKIRHQGHNSNEMLPRFLNQDRIYKSDTYGYGNRLPYDHHEIIAAIAPRAVLINTGNDDYANNPEGDAIGMEGAKPVFEFLGVSENLGFNIRTTGEKHPRGYGGGHWLSEQQIKNIVLFSDMVFYKKGLTEETKAQVYNNPYLPIIEKYFGGKAKMMPWLGGR